MDFGKYENRFGGFSRSKTDCNYLIVKLEAFEKNDNGDFRLVQSLTMAEADFNQFVQFTNQLVIAAENFGREENLSPVLTTTKSKDMVEHFKLNHKVVDVLYHPHRKISVTLLRYNVDKLEKSHCQIWLFATKEEDEKFQPIVYVNWKLEKFIYLFGVMNSVYDNAITESFCNYLPSIFYLSIRVRMGWSNGANRGLFLKLKSKLGFYYFVFTETPKPPEKFTLTLIEMQHVPDFEKSDSKKKFFV